jgi:MoxR-like ATPase
MSLLEAPEKVRREIVRDTMKRLLKRYPSLREQVYKILVAEMKCMSIPQNERSKHGFNEACCWAWWAARIHPKTVDMLREGDVIYVCGRLSGSRSPLTYKLVDAIGVAEALGISLEKLREELRERGEIAEEEVSEVVAKSREGCTFNLPEDTFNGIVGYDKVKKWIEKALCAKYPVHVLLYGAHGTAKTEIAKSVYDALKKQGYNVKIVYVSSAGTTGVGLLEALINMPEYPEPVVLIIDEVDKVRDKKVLDILAHVMEHQRFTVTKHGVDETYERNVWVIATANDITKIPPHVLDRFGALKFYFPPYTKEQFKTIVPEFLIKRLGVDRELAEYIAEKLAEAGITSVREAREIAKVAQTKEDVDELIEEFLKKRKNYWNWYNQLKQHKLPGW